MAHDPRSRFTLCKTQDDINKTSARKDFFSALGKVGDLEVLNSLGGGAIGVGLRTLATISGQVSSPSIDPATGQPVPIDPTIQSQLNGTPAAGAGFVFAATGIAASAVSAVQRLNPEVANAAQGQAEEIFTRVKNGTFSFQDIPGVISSFTNLASLASGIYSGDSSGDISDGVREVCFATNYAQVLANEHSPKNKFTFIVEFIFTKTFSQHMGEVGREASFLLKQAARPNVRFDYEDVNMYNFRTKILKRAEYDNMVLTFYDDNNNNIMKLYRQYLGLISPISRVGDEAVSFLEESGMEFTKTGNKTNELGGTVHDQSYPNSASIGALPGGEKTIFQNIRLYHIYDWGRKMNVYNFLNPKIVDMALGELDMSSSEIPEIQLTFAYDGMHIHPGADTNTSVDSKYNIETLSGPSPIIPKNAADSQPPPAPPAGIALPSIPTAPAPSISPFLKELVPAPPPLVLPFVPEDFDPF